MAKLYRVWSHFQREAIGRWTLLVRKRQDLNSLQKGASVRELEWRPIHHQTKVLLGCCKIITRNPHHVYHDKFHKVLDVDVHCSCWCWGWKWCQDQLCHWQCLKKECHYEPDNIMITNIQTMPMCPLTWRAWWKMSRLNFRPSDVT